MAEAPIRLREEPEAVPGREETREARLRRAAMRIRKESGESEDEDTEDNGET
jgi:hypothetical protein